MTRQFNIIDDGYHPELVQQSLFAGNLEIPILSPPSNIIIPKSLTPFSKRHYVKDHDTAICEYEHDVKFAQLVYDPASLADEIERYAALPTDSKHLSEQGSGSLFSIKRHLCHSKCKMGRRA